MNKKELKAEIERLQTRLAKLERVPEDTFHFGTVVVLSSANSKVYIVKKAEELWTALRGNSGAAEKSLAEWISAWLDSDIGSFEVYELRAQPNPFFAVE